MIIVEQNMLPRIKPRKPFIAFLFALFIPGLGQIYNGQIKKAIILLTVLLLNPLIFGLARGMTSFYGLATICIISVLIQIYIILDAVVNARRQNQYVPKKYNTWYGHLLIALLVFGITYTYAHNLHSIIGIQAFIIPTPSNEPTILVGDCVIADLRAYSNKEPGYGDLVVFKVQNGEFYMKRVVGLPNDTIAINDDMVSINGRKSNSTFVYKRPGDASPGEMMRDEEEFTEELPNGFKHLIYKFIPGTDSTKINMKGIAVPSDSYYVLGDSRDNSIDSRYIGCIKREDIMGQILYTYWGKSNKRININLQHSL